MRIKMPAAVNMIIEVLQQRGYEAFAVGGCVSETVYWGEYRMTGI